MHKTAVAFFGFNRPDCTKIVFEQIRCYRPRKLFLIADGPRQNVPTDKGLCEAVLNVMRAVDWECEVMSNFSETNLGCKIRMSSGIEWVFSQVEEAIFLEDDCVPCPDFFRFCSEMLAYHRDHPQVMHIAGSNFQGNQVPSVNSYYFSKFIHVWGWASWRRAWRHYDVSMFSWPQAKQNDWMSEIYPIPFEYEYWKDIFDKVYAGQIDTWNYQWAYACLRSYGISIIPNVNLITNIGAGPDATHTIGPVGSLEIPTGILGDLTHPEKVSVDRRADLFTFDHHCGGIELRRKHEAAVHGVLPDISTKTISIVLPFYNEEQNVRNFFEELENATRKLADIGYLLEYICVNDGSRDATLEILLSLRSEVACIKVVDFTRNFGKEAGLTAGLDHAEGDALIFMDTDLQHPPALIPELVFNWASGKAPVILAKRRSRNTDSISYRYLAAAFYMINNKISDIRIPPDIGDYRLIDRQVAEHLKLLPERRRFMKGLFAWVGHPTVCIEYDVQPRAGGMSSFNRWKSWNFALEGMTSFSTTPLRIWTYFGLGVSLLAFVYALWIVGKTLISGADAPGYASIMTAIMLFGGVQLISVGVLGEYIGRMYMEIKGRPVYLVKRLKIEKPGSQS